MGQTYMDVKIVSSEKKVAQMLNCLQHKAPCFWQCRFSHMWVFCNIDSNQRHYLERVSKKIREFIYDFFLTCKGTICVDLWHNLQHLGLGNKAYEGIQIVKENSLIFFLNSPLFGIGIFLYKYFSSMELFPRYSLMQLY